MIPKLIHYVWLGGEKNNIAKRAIQTWKRRAPEYQLIEWSEENIPANSNPFLKKALQDHNYAFASDYIRLLVLANNGGIYLDTDMFLLSSPTKIIENRDLVFGIQDEDIIFSSAFIAASKNNPFVKKALSLYDSLQYKNDLDPNTVMLSKLAFEVYNFDHSDEIQEREDGRVVAYSSNYLLQPSFKSVALHIGEKSWASHTKHDEIRIKLRQKITNRVEAGVFSVANEIGRRIL